MRIDYSEPKKSCITPQPAQNRPRKESSGGGALLAAIFSGILCLGIGFASGWVLSQRSAKQSFRDATAQQSIENSLQQPKIQTPPEPSPIQQPQAVSATEPTPPVVTDPKITFYNTLPSGQKNNALGSGVNSKEEKPGKQPLQAAIPANITRPVIPPNADNSQKAPLQTPLAKPAPRQDLNSFTVQVASCSLKSQAETYRTKFSARGYDVNIVESNQGANGTWYRVHVGKHLDQDAAKELAKKFGKGAISISEKE